MNIGMAVRTSYDFRRPSAHPVNRVGSYAAVALVAERGDGRHVQQAGVLRTMRSVAPQTPFRLHRCVLEHKWPSRLRVALGADRILIGGGLNVVVPEGTVRIVAVRARQKAFIHLVVEGHIERRLDV